MIRASVAAVTKIMPFWHTKNLLYYFTTSFYNISFIRCSIFLPLHLNIISLFFLILILFFLYYLFNSKICHIFKSHQFLTVTFSNNTLNFFFFFFSFFFLRNQTAWALLKEPQWASNETRGAMSAGM